MVRERYVLPTMITGPADVNRTLLELEALEDYLRQAGTRKDKAVKLPRTSSVLDSLAVANKIDLLDAEGRAHIVAFLQSVQQHAPILHISFAAEPSAAFAARIVDWLRGNVSRYTLVQIGLQPSIAAGCILRSTSKVFDMSLRRHLQQKAGLMAGQMARLRQREAAAAAVVHEPKEIQP